MNLGKQISSILIVIILLIVTTTISTNTVIAADDCWQYEGNQTGCQTAISTGANCEWKSKAESPWCPDATGCCEMKGCWDYDGNKTACDTASANGMACSWAQNDANQNPGCYITSTSDISSTNSEDIGCCETQGCWNRDASNQSYCESTTFLEGSCKWTPKANDPWCPNEVGCCSTPWCGDSQSQTESKCNALIAMNMPCSWTGSACIEEGCHAWDANQEECSNNEWCAWNSTGSTCYDPWTEGAGAVGMNEYFDEQDVKCWFADNNPEVCLNITGCTYCNSTNTQDPTSFCYNNQLNWCQGHEPAWQTIGLNMTNDSATDAIECGDLQLKQVCNFGPLGGCKWNNSVANVGQYCDTGFLTEAEKANFQAPVTFCDDTLAKNNQTMCGILKTNWFMPCEWDTEDSECKFDWESSGFGDKKGGDLDFWDINNEDTCIMAGGNWNKESYCDENGNTNYETWCEMGIGKGFEKCDNSCWACEWQDDGTDWANSGTAAAGCTASDLGFCQFSADNNAPNGFGFCDPVAEMQQNAGDCKTDCMFCNFKNSPQTSCEASNAGCAWANMTEPDGTVNSWCQDDSKKTCDSSCSECGNNKACMEDGPGCTWNVDYAYCEPQTNSGSSTEICFDGIDNDNDGQVDCADGNCAFDSFCGGDMLGDCGQYDQASCPGQTTQLGNCTWVSTDWGEEWCGMPGENCWTYDDNSTACDATNGCNFINASDMGGGGNVFCDINFALAEPCFQAQNQSTCSSIGGNCSWVADPWCSSPEGQNDPWCTSNPNMGWCDLNIVGDCKGLNATACGSNAFCTVTIGFCEPSIASKNCWQYDGNQTACLQNNLTCVYTEDNFAPSVGAGEPNGLCDPKSDFMMFQGMDTNPPVMLGTDVAGDQNGSAFVDIMGYGIKDMGDKYGMGIMLNDMTDVVACKGYPLPGGLGNGTATGKYYLYVDADEDSTSGCDAKLTNSQTDSGFELLIKYIAEYDVDSAKGILETKSLMKCSNGTWVPTSTPIFTDKKKMCKEIGGVMFAIDKSELEEFEFYDSTNNLRFAATSADANHSRSDPSDDVAAGWFTPGSIDFKFECCDCPGQDLDEDGLVSENDPDCKDFKKFGYTPKEDCWSAQDDDSDGLINCNDQDCMYDLICEGKGVNNASSQYYYGNDVTSPKVVWTKVEKFPDSAIIMYDTNEPANGTVMFYGATANCTALNATIKDIGLIDDNMPEFKDWHDAPIDNFGFNPQAIGMSLINGSTYYYKIKICDPAGNCGTSACLNFKTAKSSAKKDCPSCNPTFKFTPPAGMGFEFDFGAGYEAQSSECGVQKSYNETQNMNIKLKDDSDAWAIELINVSIKGTTLSDAAKAFESDDLKYDEDKSTASGSISYIGMNDTQKKWDELKGAGLIPKKLKLTFPKPDSGCDELWHCDDSLDSCVNLTGEAGVSLANETATHCSWYVPPTYGFSVYGGANYVASSSSSSSSSSDSSSSSSSSGAGGGGGGGGGLASYECNDGIDNDYDGLIDLNDTNCRNSRDNSEALVICSQEWNCTEWTECSESEQSRSCEQSDSCAEDLVAKKVDKISEIVKPAESQVCGSAADAVEQIAIKTTNAKEEQNARSSPGITGNSVAATYKAVWDENTGKILLFAAALIGLVLIGTLVHHRHQTKPKRKNKRRL